MLRGRIKQEYSTSPGPPPPGFEIPGSVTVAPPSILLFPSISAVPPYIYLSVYNLFKTTLTKQHTMYMHVMFAFGRCRNVILLKCLENHRERARLHRGRGYCKKRWKRSPRFCLHKLKCPDVTKLNKSVQMWFSKNECVY